MTRRKGFTLIELLVVIAIIALLIGILLPSLARAREVARRTTSAAHLKDMHIAFYQYSVSYNERFPHYRRTSATANETVKAFADQTLRGQTDANTSNGGTERVELVANMTAALWIAVRIGALTSEQFINEADPVAKEDTYQEVDVFGWPGRFQQDGAQYSVQQTWDFALPSNIRYSSINMYDLLKGQNWGSNVHPEYVLMGDDNSATNSNTDPDRGFTPRHMCASTPHTNARVDTPTREDVIRCENSINHDGEGQNFTFGDGHVAWSEDPFVGPSADNVYALDNATGTGNPPPAEDPTAPTLDTLNGAFTSVPRIVRERDATLIPITGNAGMSLAANAGAY